jgi:4-amino-4-deoxy-L-arabinose transferase-like glycosyltransferase
MSSIFSGYDLDETTKTALAIFLISLIIYSSFVVYLWDFSLLFDEGVYALMIKEFSDNPSMIIPTFAGEKAELKPPLFTWIYSLFYLFLKNLQLPIEVIHRLPSAFFSAINISLLFIIANKIYGRSTALISSLFLFTAPVILFSAKLVMMEALSLFFILGAILLYMDKRFFSGSFFLALLVLTKWLYVLSPILFIVIYYLKNKNLPKIFLSFLSVPLALVFYLILSFYFGSFENAIDSLFFDISRPSPTFNPVLLILNFLQMIFTTPLSVLFALFLLSKIDMKKEAPIIAMGAITFVLLLSQHYLYWYAIVSLPALSMFVSEKLRIKYQSDKLLLFVLIAIIAIFQVVSLSIPQHDQETREVAEFMKNKNVYFIETRPFYTNWEYMKERYIDTDKSFFLLEQNHPGILFYRFNDSNDYDNLHPVFALLGETPPCEDYLVVYGNASIADCFEPLWNKSYYSVYTADQET